MQGNDKYFSTAYSHTVNEVLLSKKGKVCKSFYSLGLTLQYRVHPVWWNCVLKFQGFLLLNCSSSLWGGWGRKFKKTIIKIYKIAKMPWSIQSVRSLEQKPSVKVYALLVMLQIIVCCYTDVEDFSSYWKVKNFCQSLDRSLGGFDGSGDCPPGWEGTSQELGFGWWLRYLSSLGYPVSWVCLEEAGALRMPICLFLHPEKREKEALIWPT